MIRSYQEARAILICPALFTEDSVDQALCYAIDLEHAGLVAFQTLALPYGQWSPNRSVFNGEA